MESLPSKYGAYVAYMLRLWQAGSRSGRPVWRASLENPHTGERLAFGTVEDLFVYLTETMGVFAETPDRLDGTASASDGEIVEGEIT